MNIDIIGVGLNLGANRLGVEQGFLKLNQYINWRELFSNHDIKSCNKVIAPSCADLEETNPMMKHKEVIFRSNTQLADLVFNSLEVGHYPLIIGGDHSLSWGSISGVAKKYTNLGCIYIDAHGDFNPAEKSPSHNVHGMHMAYLMSLAKGTDVDFYFPGKKLNSENVFFVGTRSLDEAEVALAEQYHLHIQTSDEIRTKGINAICNELLAQLEHSKISHFHLSVDIDVIDPILCPGTGVKEKDGITVDDVIYILSKLLPTGKIISIDLVEFNPLLDKEDKTLRLCTRILSKINKCWII